MEKLERLTSRYMGAGKEASGMEVVRLVAICQVINN